MSQICSQIVFTGPGRMELAERELPELAPDEVRIRTQVSLISPGTERAFFLGLPNTTQTYPQFTGYNSVGEIVAVGQAVISREPGMRVASPAHHASYVHMPETETYAVPGDMDVECAAFFNMTSIALQAVHKARIELGEPVLVIGSGLIGLLAAQIANASGALPVTVVDVDNARLEFAHRLGLETALASKDAETVVGTLPPAVVIEATGHPDAVNSALQMAAPFARVILLGSTRGVTGEVNFYRDVHRKGLHLIGAHDIARPALDSYPGYWTQSADREVALRLLAAGRVAVESLVTHRFASSQASAAYDLLRSWDSGALGIILDWRD